jgi:hypothetical protein
VHGLGLYCYQHDAIRVTLAGAPLVAASDCAPRAHDGVVFDVTPIYLPEGFYELEYTLRTDSATTYMMAAVLPGSAPRQPEGLISFSQGTLYLPPAVGPLIGDARRFEGSLAIDDRVQVVDIPPLVAQAATAVATGSAGAGSGSGSGGAVAGGGAAALQAGAPVAQGPLRGAR